MARRNFLLFALLVLADQYTRTIGKRDYEIIMNSFKCQSNLEYAETIDCYVDRSFTPPRGYIDIQVNREIETIRYSIDMILERRENDSDALFNATNLNACAYFEGGQSLLLHESYRLILMNFGKLPECPIEKGFHFAFKDIVVDAEKFPPHLSDTNFVAIIYITSGKDLVFSVEFDGDIKRADRTDE